MSQDEKERLDPDAPAAGADPSDPSDPSEGVGTSLVPREDSAERVELPKWNRARVKRKTAEGAREDAVQGGIRRAGRLTLQRAPVVMLGIVVVGALIAGGQWLLRQRSETRAEATRLLATAVAYEARGVVEDVEALTKDRKHPFPIPLFESAETQSIAVDTALKKVDQDVPDTKAAQVAALVRAARAMEVRAFADAESIYRAFLKSHPEHELVFLAEEGVVLALEGQGKVTEALAAIEPLVGRSGDFYRAQGLWHRGRLLEAAGQRDDAIAVYKQYMSEYPIAEPSIAGERVRDRLEALAPDALPGDAAAVEAAP